MRYLEEGSSRKTNSEEGMDVKEETVMKRKSLLSVILAIIMVITLLPMQRVTAASDVTKKNVRVSVDTEVCSINGYYADDSFWVSKSDVLLLTGVCPEDYSKEFGGEVCYNLAAASHMAGFGYYSYDTVLDAVYIWSKDRYCKETYDVARVMAKKEVLKNLDFYDMKTCDNTQITIAQFMSLLDSMVTYADKERLEEWQAKYSRYRQMNDKMIKAQGMYLMLYAGEFLGGDYMEIGDWEKYHYKMDNAGDGLKRYDPGALFTDQTEKVLLSDGFEWERGTAAYFYCIGREVAATGEMVAGYDKANTAIHADLPLTIQDAVDMVVRNIEASGNLRRKTDLSEEELQYVTYDEAACSVLPENALPQNLIDNINKNGVDYDKDYETGFVLTASYAAPVYYVNTMSADDIRHIAEWGFHKVRLNSGFLHFFKDDTMSEICTDALQRLDELVAAGLRYNVEIDLCIDEMPGWWNDMGSDYQYSGSIDIITNEEHREQAKSFIRMLAKRYQSVPKESLCFTPFVEYGNWSKTNGGDYIENPISYTEEQISDALMDLANAVKSVDNSREIFMETEPVDTNTVGDNTLATTKARENNIQFTYNVAAMDFVYYVFEGTDDRIRTHILQEYPLTLYAGQNWIVGTGPNRQEEAVPMILKGDFKAGSTVELYLQQAAKGTIVIKADGEVIKQEDIDPAKDENAKQTEYENVYEYEVNDKAKNYVKNYGTTAKDIEFELDKDAEKIEIGFEVEEENGWSSLVWSGLCITFPEQYAKDRWIYVPPYDADMHPEFYGNKAGYFTEHSSKLYIGNTSVENPYNEDDGTWKVKSVPYMISSDLTYSTNEICTQCDKAYIDKYISDVRKLAGDGKATVRFEFAFGGGLGSAYHGYYDNLLNAFQDNKIGWLSNDFGNDLIQKNDVEITRLGGDTYVPYYEYAMFNPVLMSIMQKYQKASGDKEGASGHVWGKGTVTKEADCTISGEMTYSCSLCGEKKTVITAKEQIHKEKEVRNKKEATENEEGYTGDTYCKRCGELIEKGKVIPKLSSKTESTEDKKTSEEGKDKDTSEEEKPIAALKLTGISKRIVAGKKLKLVPAFTPTDATNKELIWSSSNTKYATVSTKGVVTTKKKGIGKTVTIKASTKDGSEITASYKIKLVKHAVKSIKLGAKSKIVKAGKKFTVKATVKTTGSTANKTLQWSSSNTKYATVSKKGVVTTKAEGKGKTVKITAMATDGSGKKATIKIKIK